MKPVHVALVLVLAVVVLAALARGSRASFGTGRPQLGGGSRYAPGYAGADEAGADHFGGHGGGGGGHGGGGHGGGGHGWGGGGGWRGGGGGGWRGGGGGRRGAPRGRGWRGGRHWALLNRRPFTRPAWWYTSFGGLPWWQIWYDDPVYANSLVAGYPGFSGWCALCDNLDPGSSSEFCAGCDARWRQFGLF